MKSALDSRAVDIPCTKCGRKLRETIGKLKTDPQLVCTACGTRIQIDASQLRRQIAAVEKQLADLGRALGRLGK